MSGRCPRAVPKVRVGWDLLQGDEVLVGAPLFSLKGDTTDGLDTKYSVLTVWESRTG